MTRTKVIERVMEGAVLVGLVGFAASLILAATSGQRYVPGPIAGLMLGSIAVMVSPLLVAVVYGVWYLMRDDPVAPGDPARPSIHPSRAVQVGSGVALIGLVATVGAGVSRVSGGSAAGAAGGVLSAGVVACVVGSALAVAGHLRAVAESGGGDLLGRAIRALRQALKGIAIAVVAGAIAGVLVGLDAGCSVCAQRDPLVLLAVVVPVAVPFGVFNLLVSGLVGRSPWQLSAPVAGYGSVFLVAFMVAAGLVGAR